MVYRLSFERYRVPSPLAMHQHNRQGQSCSFTSRVLVHHDLHDTVIEEMIKLVENLPIGLPWIETNELGPIVSEFQYEKILE